MDGVSQTPSAARLENTKPTARPIPPKIDPEKFIGGTNVERLKTLLKDVDEFASSVKDKGKQLTETLNLLHSVTVRFGEVVERMDMVVTKLEGKNGLS